MLTKIFFLGLMIFSLSAFSQDDLKEIRKQIAVLKARVDLLGPSKELSEELTKLELKEKSLASGEVPQVVEVKEKKKAKKVEVPEQAPTVKVSATEKSAPKNEPYVINIDKTKSLKDQYQEILVLLETEQSALVNALDDNKSSKDIKRRLAYLELERTKIQKAMEKTSSDVIAAGNSKGKGAELRYRGHFQFRNEGARNIKGISNTNQRDQSFYRFRTYLTFVPNSKMEFNLTPQATKGFGANNAGGASTSGSNVHTELFMFEANLHYKFSDDFSAKLGKQEIAYGDHLVIGTAPWDNSGRSFDALRLNYKYALGWSELFYSKVNDNSSPTNSEDDAALSALYNSWNVNNYLKPFELYLINLDDRKKNAVEVNMAGYRIKGEVGSVFYRSESGAQNGKNLDGDAFQTSNEIGLNIYNHKVSYEYGLSGDGYRQLYPTAHRFLGIADLLGRRNLEYHTIHIFSQVKPWLTFNIDQHFFNRNNTNKSAYKLNGASAWGTNGTAKEIGHEIDFIMNIKSSDMITLQLGGGFFNPGKYLKDQTENTGTQTRFLYAQVLGEF